jgi:hypothetical protein
MEDSPLKQELKEKYFLRDGFLREVAALRTDRECFPVPKELIERFQAQIRFSIDCLERLLKGAEFILQQPEGTLWSELSPAGTVSEHRFNTVASRLPVERIIELTRWFHHLLDFNREDFLFDNADRLNKEIKQIKAAMQENSPAGILARLKAGLFDPRFANELMSALKEELDKQEKAKQEAKDAAELLPNGSADGGAGQSPSESSYSRPPQIGGGSEV